MSYLFAAVMFAEPAARAAEQALHVGVGHDRASLQWRFLPLARSLPRPQREAKKAHGGGGCRRGGGGGRTAVGSQLGRGNLDEAATIDADGAVQLQAQGGTRGEAHREPAQRHDEQAGQAGDSHDHAAPKERAAQLLAACPSSRRDWLHVCEAVVPEALQAPGFG